MIVRLVDSEADIRDLAPVLLQLRPEYSEDALIERIRLQMNQGYHLACVYMNEVPVCVAGFVINEKLAWGRHLYVDDLVTDEAHRSLGAGKAMLGWLKAHAREQGCTQLHMDSGLHRLDAHRLYEREGLPKTSWHFSTTAL